MRTRVVVHEHTDWADGRQYCGQKVALSMTGAFAGEEVVVYDTGSGWGPAESADGNSIPFDATEAQFVRHWSAGSTGNDGVNFIEAEFYGQPATGAPTLNPTAKPSLNPMEQSGLT